MEVSALMLVYKEPLFVIERAIISILKQSRPVSTFVVILDNPNYPEAEKLLEKFSNTTSSFKFFVNEENIGRAESRNKAVRLCTTEYFIWQDADDESLANRIDELAREWQPGLDLIGSAINYTNSFGEKLFKRSYPVQAGKYLAEFNTLAQPSLLIRTAAYNHFGYYNPAYLTEDYELWCRWYCKGAKFQNISAATVNYYQNEGQGKSTHTKLQLRETIKIKWKYRKCLPFSFKAYLRLIAESFLLLLPASAILYLFYLKNRT